MRVLHWPSCFGGLGEAQSGEGATEANPRSEPHTASPNHQRLAHPLIVGTTLSSRRMRTRMYGRVAGEERRLSPLCRLHYSFRVFPFSSPLCQQTLPMQVSIEVNIARFLT